MIKSTGYMAKKLSLYLTVMITFAAVINNGAITVSADIYSTIEATTEHNEEAQTPTEALITDPLLELNPELTPSAEITITPSPELTSVPSPELTITPSPELTPVPSTELTITPSPELTITPSPEPTPTPTKVQDKFIPKTLQLMAKYDYVGKSVTGISNKKGSVKTLQTQINAFGKLYGTGMPYQEYKEAMLGQWVDATEYNKKPGKIAVDITKSMNYDSYVKTLKSLSRYEGVYLYKIGKSTQGRDLYAIEIDMKSDKAKSVIMLTGQIHAREFGGGTFIVKQFVDLVQKAQTDKKTMELLMKYKYVAVPIINVDGREALIKETSNWTIGGGQLWKAYTNGTDGGRNFPGLQWGQVKKGSYFKVSIAKKPGYANYAGKYAGSNSETKALMKWMYHYTIVEQASFYLDLHQQGSIIYAGKTWQTKLQEQKSLDLRTKVLSIINKGITRRKYTRVYEETAYGLRGEGSSLTDYAVTLAVGAKFSPAYGFSAFTDGKMEYILMQIKDLDKKIIKVKEANKNFAAVTLEIGYGSSYLGNSSNTRRLLANEYNYFNFGKLLETLPSLMK